MTYVCPFQKNKYVATFCWSLPSVFVEVNASRESLFSLLHPIIPELKFETKIKMWICLLIPSHQIDHCALSLNFCMPWGPLWIFESISSWSNWGITMSLPLRSRPPAMWTHAVSVGCTLAPLQGALWPTVYLYSPCFLVFSSGCGGPGLYDHSTTLSTFLHSNQASEWLINSSAYF